MNCRFLLWFCCNEEEKDDNFRHLLQWLCYQKMATFLVVLLRKGDGSNVITFLYGGWVEKKVMGACDFFFPVLMV